MADLYAHLRTIPFSTLAGLLGIDLQRFRQRKDEWSGYCAIHQSQKNNNCFHYNQSTGAYHCFGCNAKGRGALDLTMAVKAVNFTQACEILGQAPKPSPDTKKEPVEAPSDSQRHSDGILRPFDGGTYRKFAKPCAWLTERIPDQGVLDRYGVFFYENNARKSKVNGHVLVPIKDLDGQLFGYLARNIGQVTADRPKYWWPANLPKTKFVFGAAELKAAQPVPVKVLYVVESCWAVMKLASLKIPAVALNGWSVSDDQIDILVQLAKGLCFLPDKNKAQECAGVVHRLAQRLWVKAPPLPDGVDDAEYLSEAQLKAL